MTLDLSVSFGDLELRTPVVLASGTWGYGTEGAAFTDYSRVGALCMKGITRRPRPGNAVPRAHETPSGLMNSVGLENVGIDVFIAEKLPAARALGTKLIANIAADSADEFGEMAGMLAGAEGVDAIELNVSCPNVKRGGQPFGVDAGAVAEVVREARRAAPRMPLLAKLTPQASDIVGIAAAAMDAGANGLTVANSHPAVAVDVRSRRPVFANIVAGLSGPAIRPLTLRLVWMIHSAMPGVPIVGTGGVATWEDAVEYMLAGATAVGIGSVALLDPGVAANIADGIEDYCRENGVTRVRDLTGGMHA